jgi:hypothetical protein
MVRFRRHRATGDQQTGFRHEEDPWSRRVGQLRADVLGAERHPSQCDRDRQHHRQDAERRARRRRHYLVKEGGTQKGSVTTNAQGLATFACNFNDNNANEHNLAFELQPPTGSKIMAASTRLPVIGGSVQKLDMTAVEDLQGPAIANLVLKQIGAHNIDATFSLNDATATSSLAYEDPKGRAGATDWNSGSGNQTDPTSFHHIILQGNNLDPGRYKIKVKAKDARGNITEGPFVEFTLFGESLWNLHATNVGQNSALLRWNRFPAANEASFNKFGKYVLKVGNQTPIEITNADTTSCAVQNLSANTTYNASIHVVMAGSSGYLTVPGTASFQTLSSPPVISNLTVQPSVSPMKENIQVRATLADADTNVKKATLTLVDPNTKKDLTSKTYNANNVAFEHSFKLDEPGEYTLVLAAADEAGETAAEQKITVLETEKPKISLTKVPSTSNVGDTVAATVRIANIESLKGDLECHVNWGDGTDETVPLKGKEKLALAQKPSQRATRLTCRMPTRTTGPSPSSSAPTSPSRRPGSPRTRSRRTSQSSLWPRPPAWPNRLRTTRSRSTSRPSKARIRSRPGPSTSATAPKRAARAGRQGHHARLSAERRVRDHVQRDRFEEQCGQQNHVSEDSQRCPAR